ncbi:MAG TPA: TetR/AcrR family transcriptional regulator [Edaphobacter sp.]|nr:TetR/AcrR family transcriptional regulator [Edaphobacter sp.]
MSKPAKTPKPTPARTTFRHGDLHRTLLAAGIELARAGGPTAVILREATRRAGVAPNAAYRHFSSHAELLAAVRAHALSQLARAIEAEIAAIPPRRRGAALARAHLRAVGIGYLTFALHQPGLFRTAFTNTQPVAGDSDKAKTGASGLNPFQLLGHALDLMALHRLLPPRRRAGVEYLAWSAVHGLAFLIIDGPLHHASPAEIATLSERLILMVEKGLSS